MAISAGTIDQLFKKLGAVYGAAWDRSMGSAPINDVKTEWSSQLSRFNRADLEWAIEHLTDRCPNVIAFRELCRQAPRPDAPRLEAPAPNPQVVAEHIAKQTGVMQAIATTRHNPKEWAPRIMARLKNGEKISPTIVKMAREVAESMD